MDHLLRFETVSGAKTNGAGVRCGQPSRLER
jgi:hypothetical protein